MSNPKGPSQVISQSSQPVAYVFPDEVYCNTDSKSAKVLSSYYHVSLISLYCTE